jgi:hypothetical protein
MRRGARHRVVADEVRFALERGGRHRHNFAGGRFPSNG